MFITKSFLHLIITLNCFLSAQQLENNPYMFLDYESEKKKTASIDKILFPAGTNTPDPELVHNDGKNLNLLPDMATTTCIDTVLDQKNIKTASMQNEKILLYAKEYIGLKYGFGTNSKLKMDCSGFTQQIYKKLGISLPRSAVKQSFFGVKIGFNELKVGDLLFYRTYKSTPSHVAIYVGNRKMIHASYIAKQIQFDSIDKSYYKERFLFAKRLHMGEK